MKTLTGKMKQHLESAAECRFEKAPDLLGHVCYIGNELVAESRTLGDCIWKAAKELGEDEIK